MEIILGTLFYVVTMKGQAAVIVFDIRKGIYRTFENRAFPRII